MRFSKNPLFLLVIILFFTLLFSGCNLSPDSGGQETFWAQNLVNYSWYSVDAALVYTGSYCKVYVQNEYTNQVSKNTANVIANDFDQNVYTRNRSKFGTEPDVDGDGKVTILVLDIKDGYSGSGGYVAGYFDSTHELSVLHSNKKDMLFMDCSPGTAGDSTFNLTMAHEFQHMINYNQKVFVQGVGAQDTWINEGLSTAAESVYLGMVNSDRVSYYNSDPYGDITKGQAFVAWNSGVGSTYTSALGNYSTVYLFFQWLKYQSSNGDGIYKEIINNTGVDYNAVQTVASSRLGTASWHDLLMDWYIANIINDASTIYGYKGNISTSYHTTGSSGSYALYPGEGVYQTIPGSYVVSPSSPIDYAGINTGTKAVDNAGTTYTGNKLVAFNYNGNPLGSSANATLLNYVISDSKSGLSTESLSPELEKFKQDFLSGKKPLPIDAILDHKGNSTFKSVVSNTNE